MRKYKILLFPKFFPYPTERIYKSYQIIIDKKIFKLQKPFKV